MVKAVNNKTIYYVKTLNFYSINEVNEITMLYQPITSSNATSLYLTILAEWEFAKNYAIEKEHQRLFDITNLTKNEFIESIEQLESVGLIRTYYKKDEQSDKDSVIYELYKPKDPKSFFSSDYLSTKLKTSLSELDFEMTKSYFKLPKVSLNNYQEVTNIERVNKAINEISPPSINKNNSKNKNQDIRSLKQTATHNLQQSNQFKQSAKIVEKQVEQVKKHKEEVDKEILELKNKRSNFLEQKLKEHKISNTVTSEVLEASDTKERKVEKESKNETGLMSTLNLLESLNQTAEIDTNVNYYYANEKNKDDNLDVDAKKMQKKVNNIKTLDPFKYFKYRSNVEPNEFQKEVIYKMKKEMDLPNDIINIIIDHNFNRNGYVNKNYALKIAQTIKDNNIVKLEQAVKFLKNAYDKSNKNKRTKPVHTNQYDIFVDDDNLLDFGDIF